MELEDTVELMTSDGYKDRFRGEYQQTKIGYGCTKRNFYLELGGCNIECISCLRRKSSSVQSF